MRMASHSLQSAFMAAHIPANTVESLTPWLVHAWLWMACTPTHASDSVRMPANLGHPTTVRAWPR
ncbi:hypothetical protein EWM64_g6867 [Hericium alpestre]|uniref:Uncharacterized protein n=1 Tax=Hericium alpestre TaxID=135208 RepID=A0A4Y9ZRD5_9AGAM|nr:hypothetical protein EWM64_g6867 [Hericium alpestre]